MKITFSCPKNKKQHVNLNSKKVLTTKTNPTGESVFSHQKFEFHDLKEAQQTGFNSIPSISIENMIIGVSEAGWSGDWHNEPFPLIGISLCSLVELEVSSGEKQIIKKGDLVIGLDTHGQGHRTANIGKEENLLVAFQLCPHVVKNI